MLEFVRTRLKDSIFIKIFMGLLMISFGVWGIGDFIGTPGLDPAVAAKVGKSQMGADEFSRRYNRELDRLKESMGQEAAAQEGVKRSVADSVIQDFTNTATLDGAGLDFGIVITPERLRGEIQKEEAFKGPGEVFSTSVFAQVLIQNNLNEAAFLKIYASDMRRTTILKPIVESVVAPKAMVDSLYTYRGEARVADTLFIPASAMAIPTAPSDEEFKKLYEENITSFTAPEYRKLTSVVLTAADLTHPENIEEADVRAFYDENVDRYRGKESRHVLQMVFDSEEKAAEIKTKAAAGDTLATLAAKTKSDAPIDLGNLTSDSPVAAALGAIFVLPEKQISDPIKSDLGWHLIEIKAITPAAPTPYDEVKEKIRSNLAQERASDAVAEASVQLEDGLAGGTTLPELAKLTGGKLIELAAVDREGKDPNGGTLTGFPEWETFLRAAFTTAVNSDTGLKNLASRNGYFVIRVESVTPPAAKPLESVRSEVSAMWARQAKINEASALAAKLSSTIGPSTALSSLEATEKRVSYGQLGPIRRFGDQVQRDHIIDARRVSPEVLAKMFSVKVGEVFSAPVAEGFVVGRLKEISTPQVAEADPNAQKQIVDNVKGSIQSDLADQLTRALGRRYATEVNNTLIDQTVGQQ